MGESDVIVVILAIVLPPVAVVIRRGCGADLIINLILCLFGHIPGILHAIYIVWHDRDRRRQARTPYVQQTNAQAVYGAPAYGDNKVQQQTPYSDQPKAMTPEPTPSKYTDEIHVKGEKQEYATVANG